MFSATTIGGPLDLPAGLEKVQVEFGIVAMAHNLLKCGQPPAFFWKRPSKTKSGEETSFSSLDLF